MKNKNYYSETDDISFTPLTVEQENSLFDRFYKGDLTARDELIKSHLKLVAKLSLQISRGLLPDDDAISAGNFGLIQCLEAKNFETGRRVRFGSYVRLYVRGQILIAIREKLSTGRGSVDHHGERHAVCATLTGCLSRQAPESWSGDVKGKNVFEVFRKRLDDECFMDGQATLDASDRAAVVQHAIDQLSDVEAAAIRGTYYEGLSFAAIGRQFRGLTREGVRKAHDRALEKLKELLSFLEQEFAPEKFASEIESLDFRPEQLDEAA